MSATRDRRKRDKDVGGKPDVRTEKPPSRQKSKPDISLPPSDDVNRQMYERTLYMTMNLVGRVVQVQVKSGAIYEGILHTAHTEKGFGVVLKMARKKESGATVVSAPSPTLIIQPKDFVQLIAKDISFDEVADSSNEEVFMTDTDISGHTDMKERELQPWVPEGDYSADLSLASSGYRNNWDQFEANEKLFGVKTTYEEEIYTTPLDKGSHLYVERARAAQRIADEIEGRATNNIHLAEERGQVNPEDMDEEERYSSVIRSGGKYIPPAKRNAAAAAASASSTHLRDSKENKEKEKEKEKESHAKEQDLRVSSEMPASALNEDGAGEPRQTAVSPSSPSMATHPSVVERLRLRKALVNEAHRTSPTPIHPSNNEMHSTSKPQSPLHSPLVGDPKTITALGLEPRAPTVPQGVVRDFLEFSLIEKAKQNPSRQTVTAELKQFSELMNSKRPNSPSHSSAPTSPGPTSPVNTAATASHTPDSSATPSKPAVASAPSTPSTAASTPSTSTSTPSTPAASTPATSTATSAATSASTAASTTSSTTPATTPSTTPTLRPLSKLNPNAKVFTPMSASASVFTPKSFVPAAVAPAPIMPPSDHGIFFHSGPPMAHHVHPNLHSHPHAHSLHPSPMVPPAVQVDPRPVTEIYCDAMKRKTHHEKSEATQPYWYGTRGSYRTNVEEMDPTLHRSFPPNPSLTPIGVVGMPIMGPTPPHPAHGHPHGHPHPHALQPPMGPNFPPYVLPPNPISMNMMNMGPPPVGPQPQVPMTVGGPPQPQVVATPIFVGQPAMRPYPPHGVPHQPAPIVGMAPVQPPYVSYPPQMTPHSPPVGHQPPSPQPQPLQSQPIPIPQPQQPPLHMHGPPPPHVYQSAPPQSVYTSPPHTAHTPPLVPHHSPQPTQHASASSPSAGSGSNPNSSGSGSGSNPGTAQPPLGGGQKRAFYPPTQPQQNKPGYSPATSHGNQSSRP